MFVIRKAQLEVFRIPLRKKKREETFLQLQAVEGNTVSQEQDKIIVEDQKGRVSRLHYSEKNLLAAIEKPSGMQVGFEYDEEDRVNRLAFPGNENLRLTYENDVPTRISLNDANIDLKYDAKSRLNEIVYPDDRSVFFEYNDLNQISATVDRVHARQQYQTNIEDGRLIHYLTDALGRTTTLWMDTIGSLERVAFPDGSTCEVRYDDVLEAEIVKLRNGTERTTYLDGPHPYRVEWEDGHFQNIDLNDALQVERIENQTGTIGYKYDDHQRLVSESFQDQQVSYQYDGDNLRSMVYPSGLEVEYVYDEDDRLTKIQVAGQTVMYAYAPNGTIAEVHYPNGLVEYQKNYLLGGLKEKKLVNRLGQLLSQEAYQYDTLSRLSSYQHYAQQGHHSNCKLQYDAAGRLTEVADITSGYSESFRYDIKGNLTQANQQRVVTGLMNEVKSIGNREIGYDSGGNVNQFIDEQGRLVQLKYANDGVLKFSKINDDVWEYWYDALGRRVGKSNSRETYKFLWAGERLLQEDYKANDASTTREYIYADSSTPIGFKEANEFYWFRCDVRSAITDVYNNKGALAWKATYTAFGKANVIIESVRQPWRLAGQYFDKETGLHYNDARYYSPFLCAFLNLDPLWHKYGANNYSYAANDPYNKADKNGQFWHIVAGGVAGAVIGGGVSAYMAPEGEKASAFLHGALQGAFAGALTAATGGAGILAGAAGSGIGEAFAGFIEGGKICVECVKQAIISGLAGGIAGFAIGKSLAPIIRRILPYAPKARAFFTKVANRLTNKVRGTTKKEFFETVVEFRNSAWQMKLPENRKIADEAWDLWVRQDWEALEKLFNKGMVGRKGNIQRKINAGWPPNDGFISKTKDALQPGKKFDRYGGVMIEGKFTDGGYDPEGFSKLGGRFTAKPGTPFCERALPEDFVKSGLTEYEVANHIEIIKGPAIPWFGGEGKGIQYMLPQNINVLEDFGYITPLKVNQAIPVKKPYKP